jgi:VIT1/CCC1 family predicted Fe2+/Mn2+ transporter
VQELASLYRQRGLESALARQVAEQLMAKDALDAHAREELGLTETNSAQPLQAAMFSAFSFSAGALLPVIIAWLAPAGWFFRSLFSPRFFRWLFLAISPRCG